jgi:hypothetical protein
MDEIVTHSAELIEIIVITSQGNIFSPKGSASENIGILVFIHCNVKRAL